MNFQVKHNFSLAGIVVLSYVTQSAETILDKIENLKAERVCMRNSECILLEIVDESSVFYVIVKL